METKIIRKDIINSIYEKTDFKQKDIELIIDEFLNEIKQNLTKRKTIELRGFGSFIPTKRKGRKNLKIPNSNELFNSEDHFVAIFKPGAEIKQKMKEIKE